MPLLLRAQPPHPPLRDPVPSSVEFIGDEPVSELRIIGVDVVGGVEQVGILPVPMADWGCSPFVEGLFGKAQDPAGHRHRDSGGGKVTDQRETHFGREPPSFKFACDR